MTRTTAQLTALLLAAAVALAGCAAGTSAAPTSPAATVEAPAPVETTPAVVVSPVVVPPVGSTITTDVEVKAATDAGLVLWDQLDANGNRTSSIVFAKGAPLLEQVKAAVAAPITAAHAASVATGIKGDSSTETQDAAMSAARTLAQKMATQIAVLSGRRIMIVTVDYGSLDGTHYGWLWYPAASKSAVYPPRTITANKSREAIVAAIQQWTAAQPHPDTYDIIVTD